MPHRHRTKQNAEADPRFEAVLSDPAALWTAIARVSGEYIVIVDRGGIIRSCNRVDEGFSLDQIVGHSVVRFTLPESSQQLSNAVRDVFDSGQDRSLETTVRGLDGSLNYFSLRLGPIVHGGETTAVMVCCENIRPLKTSEQILRRERNVLRRLIEIQERERQLVSYEIHDGLAQYLAGALMHLEACRHAERDRHASQELEEGIRLLRAAAEESRRLIGGLRPPALDELGIVDAIESLVADARTEIPTVSFTHSLPGERLPPGLETTIFRIVQESLSNARKHAEAGTARVVLERAGDTVRVAVEDDGRGFEPAAVPEQRFGLEGIRQRCRLLGIEPRIESIPGRGTTIEAVLPVAGEPAP
ncbi:MAG: PAS domain S-box protein [Planctomycetia bacterium]|nr:PAS domain S-box protein [Planctomycetia bacterium]